MKTISEFNATCRASLYLSADKYTCLVLKIRSFLQGVLKKKKKKKTPLRTMTSADFLLPLGGKTSHSKRLILSDYVARFTHLGYGRKFGLLRSLPDYPLNMPCI